jgi:hypothetical protein
MDGQQGNDESPSQAGSGSVSRVCTPYTQHWGMEKTKGKSVGMAGKPPAGCLHKLRPCPKQPRPRLGFATTVTTVTTPSTAS